MAQLWRVNDLCARYNVSRSALTKWVREERLPPPVARYPLHWKRDDVERYEHMAELCGSRVAQLRKFLALKAAQPFQHVAELMVAILRHRYIGLPTRAGVAARAAGVPWQLAFAEKVPKAEAAAISKFARELQELLEAVNRERNPGPDEVVQALQSVAMV